METVSRNFSQNEKAKVHAVIRLLGFDSLREFARLTRLHQSTVYDIFHLSPHPRKHRIGSLARARETLVTRYCQLRKGLHKNDDDFVRNYLNQWMGRIRKKPESYVFLENSEKTKEVITKHSRNQRLRRRKKRRDEILDQLKVIK